MLSLSSEQGMGQYRWNSNPTVPYISNCVTFGPRQKNNEDPSYDKNPTYLRRGNVDSIAYRDIQIDFGTSKDSLNNENETGYIKSKKEYYLHLEVPQHIQYTTILKIKVCAINTNVDGEGLNPKAYQEIRELVIPPAPPKADDNIIETIMVYEDPEYFQKNDESILNGDKIIAFKWASPTKKYIHAGIVYNANLDGVLFKAGEIYTDGSDYFKCPGDGTNPTITPSGEEDNPYKLINYNLGLIQKDWLIAGSAPSIATFDIVFSPKFELGSNYQYILLEIDRSNEIQQQIQYVPEIDNNEKYTYYGTYMDLDYVKGELWSINNLLGNSIRTAASQNILNHIAVWGHPELLLCINGEEIKVGQTDFYEVEDYSIDFLGVVAKDSADRFTIDYQYPLTITNSDTTDEQGG